MNSNMQLSLKGDTFTALQEDFDSILEKAISNMELKGADEAVVTVKLKVKLENCTVQDTQCNGYDGTRDIVKPSFSHDISYVMQVKDKKSGSLAGDYELVWDKVAGAYYMRDVDDGQVSIDGFADVVVPDGWQAESTDSDNYAYDEPDEEE